MQGEGEGDGDRGDGHGWADDLDGLVLDESFVRGAAVREPSAAERERAQARARARAEAASAYPAARPPRPSSGPTGVVGRAAARVGGPWQLVTLVAVVVVVLGIGWSQARGTAGGLNPYERTQRGGDVLVIGGEVADFPSPPADPSDVPLGAPPAVDPEAGSHAFTQTDHEGDPVRYDPCRPVGIVVNGRTAPVGADRLVAEAVQEVRRATGLHLVVEGPTDEAPSAERRPVQDRYGDRWAPVLLAWSDPSEVPELASDVAGLGGSLAVEKGDAPATYVTGLVALDGPDLADVLAAPGGWEAARAVVVHELAHLVGLDHVDDPSELMHPEGGGVTTFGPGDRAGLAVLGRGPCVPDL